MQGAVQASVAARSRGAYTISDVELLLKACNMLLWPQVMVSWRGGSTEGGPEPLDAGFLAAWSAFLTGIGRNIKALQPEDQAVKALATRMDLQYKEMASDDKSHFMATQL